MIGLLLPLSSFVIVIDCCSKLHLNVCSQFCGSGIQNCLGGWLVSTPCIVTWGSFAEAGGSTSKMTHSHGWLVGVGSELTYELSKDCRVRASVPLHTAFPWGYLGFFTTWWLGYTNECSKTLEVETDSFWHPSLENWQCITFYYILLVKTITEPAQIQGKKNRTHPSIREVLKKIVTFFNIWHPSIDYFQGIISDLKKM